MEEVVRGGARTGATPREEDALMSHSEVALPQRGLSYSFAFKDRCTWKRDVIECGKDRAEGLLKMGANGKGSEELGVVARRRCANERRWDVLELKEGDRRS